jgi:mRNA-degrading endonuclease RelE of RelBE toxin-antitoxin system
LKTPLKYLTHVKLKGETGVYRARVGKYRILYSIFAAEKLILVLKVDKRDRAYR